MKQTAVEWLVDQLEKKGEASVNMSIGRMQISIIEEDYINLIEQAKEMEKQKMIEMHDKGFDSVVQLNDDYAIGFAEWCLRIRFEPIENPSVKKLLEIYKKDNL